MRKLIYITAIIAAIFMFVGCAQTYNTIRPTRLTYNSNSNLEDIKLEYRYDVLRERGNSKYRKKEDKFNIKLVAVKITNNTDEVIMIGKNAAFFNDKKMLFPLEAYTARNYLKQSTPPYLLYLLLTRLILTVNYDTYPIGLVLGPGITVGNMLTASTANKKLYQELIDYEIAYREILPNETVYGLVAFKGLDYAALTIKRINH
jgi:hypothetical protein